MAIAAIEKFLKKRTGIDVQITGIGSLSHFVNRRMEALGLKSNSAYLTCLKKNDKEVQELVNLITIPETWFFRDAEPFKYLNNYVSEYLLAKDPQTPLSVLSLPCSTGEEPYSIAMTLDDCGVSLKNIHIDAYDINQHSLEKAKRAVYRDNSFRSIDLSFRDKYFTKVEDGYQLTKSIVDTVNFHHGNALDIYEAVSGKLYNVIFCRNLLIYFDKKTQERVLLQLKKILLKDGRVFVGHAEASELVMSMFESVGGKGSFAYQTYPDGKVRNALSDYLNTDSSVNYALPAKVKKTKNASSKTGAVHKKVRNLKPIDKSLIKDIERKADNGELDEAARLCGLLVEQGTEDANVLCLCGVINEVRGDLSIACDLFEKSLEFNPNHYEAAVHLAESLEAQGLTEAAIKMRERAKSIASKNEQ